MYINTNFHKFEKLGGKETSEITGRGPSAESRAPNLPLLGRRNLVLNIVQSLTSPVYTGFKIAVRTDL